MGPLRPKMRVVLSPVNEDSLMFVTLKEPFRGLEKLLSQFEGYMLIFSLNITFKEQKLFKCRNDPHTIPRTQKDI